MEKASFGTRFIAALVDGVILLVVNGILYVVLGQSASQGLGTLISLGYFTYFEGGVDGQTLGKKMAGIKVVDTATGGEAGYGKAIIRWITRIISAIPCLLGYFWMLFDKDKQTWHDKLSGTSVVSATASASPGSVI